MSSNQDIEVIVLLTDGSEGNVDSRAEALILQFTTEQSYDRLYEIEVYLHPMLAIIPPKSTIWRSLRPRVNWRVILIFYLLFVIGTSTIGAIIGAAQNDGPSIYSYKGIGCVNEDTDDFPYGPVNGTFKYYLQGRIGMCVEKEPQEFGSSKCILWTDETFWENFEIAVDNDDYSNSGCSNCNSPDATGDAEANAQSEKATKYLSIIGIIATLVRPLESLFSVLTRNKKYWIFQNRVALLLKSCLMFFFYFCNLLNTLFIGLVGAEGVDACLRAKNWEVYYGCQSVTRTPLSALTPITASAIMMSLYLLLVAAPEILTHLFYVICFWRE
jgi:hypothetical protein